MYWINNGRYSVHEVEETFGIRLDIVSVNNFNAGKGRDYAYWESITHPQTGEKLSATIGYLDRDSNKCYYAEYQGCDGKFYNYTAGMDGESISSYQSRDEKTRAEKLKYEEARKRFSDMLNGKMQDSSFMSSLQQENQYKVEKF